MIPNMVLLDVDNVTQICERKFQKINLQTSSLYDLTLNSTNICPQIAAKCIQRAGLCAVPLTNTSRVPLSKARKEAFFHCLRRAFLQSQWLLGLCDWSVIMLFPAEKDMMYQYMRKDEPLSKESQSWINILHPPQPSIWSIQTGDENSSFSGPCLDQNLALHSLWRISC